MNTPWKIEFDEYGGYDCMTSAYNIYDCKGELLTEIDTGISDRDENDDEVKKARKIAELIIKSVNKFVEQKGDEQ